MRDKPRPLWCTYALLMGLSLLVRVVLWIPVAQSGMPPIHDEGSYLTRAVGYGAIVEAWCSGRAPEPDDWAWSYREGAWPPLHPILIGLAFAVLEPNLALARFIVLLQSALTTGVVFALTRRTADRRAAVAAGLIHVFYPSFLAYSHLLWSETTYALMLLTSLYFAVRTVDARGKTRTAFALLCGGFLGLAGLARAAILPLLFAVPAWLGWRLPRGPRRIVLPLAALATSIAVLTPWLWKLHAEENRFVPLSTAAGYNLYLGNNPWSFEDQARREAAAPLQAYENEHGVSRDEAGRVLALQYIRDDIPAFARRCWAHARAMCVPDWYALRHVFYAHYPPVPPVAAVILLALFFFAFAALAGVTTWAFVKPSNVLRYRSLPLICLLFGVLPNFMTIANSRMLVPLLILILPLAGHGLADWIKRRRGIWPAATILIAAGVIRLLNPSFPIAAFGSRNQMSTFHAASAQVLHKYFGARRIHGKDRVMVRYVGGKTRQRFRFELITASHVFGDTRESTADWRPAPRGDEGRLEIITPRAADGKPVLRVTNMVTAQSADVNLVSPNAWRRWTPTGVDGLDFKWLGAAGIQDEQTAALLRQTSLLRL